MRNASTPIIALSSDAGFVHVFMGRRPYTTSMFVESTRYLSGEGRTTNELYKTDFVRTHEYTRLHRKQARIPRTQGDQHPTVAACEDMSNHNEGTSASCLLLPKHGGDEKPPPGRHPRCSDDRPGTCRSLEPTPTLQGFLHFRPLAFFFPCPLPRARAVRLGDAQQSNHARARRAGPVVLAQTLLQLGVEEGRPALVPFFGFAPAASRSERQPGLSPMMANWSGVGTGALTTRCGDPPDVRSTSRQRLCPSWAARVTGVMPLGVAMLGFAPPAITVRTICAREGGKKKKKVGAGAGARAGVG